MLAKIFPIIFLLIGTGTGIGIGLFLTPDSNLGLEAGERINDATHTSVGDSHATKMGSQDPMMDKNGNVIGYSASEFVEMSNQFVIPVVKNNDIIALVIVSLSLETRYGASEIIYAREPKLRDAFLSVLFDHANMGGFHGAFTSAETLDLLRSALREVAQMQIGEDVLDVLILDIIRQDT